MNGLERANNQKQEHDLGWLLEACASGHRKSSTSWCFPETAFGLCFTEGLEVDKADHLAAIASGIRA